MFVPPAPGVPPEAVGQPAVGIIAMYAGPLEEGLEALAPLKELAPPAIDMIGPIPYVQQQRLIDEGNPKGAARLLQGRVHARR